MTSQPRDKTRDSTKHDTAKFGLDLHGFGNSGVISKALYRRIFNAVRDVVNEYKEQDWSQNCPLRYTTYYQGSQRQVTINENLL